MTQEQYEEIYNWVYEEIHHNRDSYSMSKIIEMIMNKTEKLVNKTNDIHDVSYYYLKDGDEVMSGDEYYNEDKGCWRTIKVLWIYPYDKEKCYKIRRKI